jgi:hypothetical protein
VLRHRKASAGGGKQGRGNAIVEPLAARILATARRTSSGAGARAADVGFEYPNPARPDPEPAGERADTDTPLFERFLVDSSRLVAAVAVGRRRARFPPRAQPVLSYFNYHQETIASFISNAASDLAADYGTGQRGQTQSGVIEGRSLEGFPWGEEPPDWVRGDAYLAPNELERTLTLGGIESLDCPGGERGDPEDATDIGESHADKHVPASYSRRRSTTGAASPSAQGRGAPASGAARQRGHVAGRRSEPRRLINGPNSGVVARLGAERFARRHIRGHTGHVVLLTEERRRGLASGCSDLVSRGSVKPLGTGGPEAPRSLRFEPGGWSTKDFASDSSRRPEMPR